MDGIGCARGSLGIEIEEGKVRWALQAPGPGPLCSATPWFLCVSLGTWRRAREPGCALCGWGGGFGHVSMGGCWGGWSREHGWALGGDGHVSVGVGA